MSPIAAILAVALAGAASPAAPRALTVPPIVVDVALLTEVSPKVVSAAIEETQALFRSAGVSFIWRRGSPSLGALRVMVSAERGPTRDGATPLGWLNFENGEPTREIHLSYANVEAFMEQAREVVGVVGQKTPAERYRLLGRALGRALAHELGHYLLATATHTPKGLLKGSRSAQEFFSPDRSSFAMDLGERLQVAARVLREFDVARRYN
jgi:hypothetical protein